MSTQQGFQRTEDRKTMKEDQLMVALFARTADASSSFHGVPLGHGKATCGFRGHSLCAVFSYLKCLPLSAFH